MFHSHCNIFKIKSHLHGDTHDGLLPATLLRPLTLLEDLGTLGGVENVRAMEGIDLAGFSPLTLLLLRFVTGVAGNKMKKRPLKFFSRKKVFLLFHNFPQTSKLQFWSYVKFLSCPFNFVSTPLRFSEYRKRPLTMNVWFQFSISAGKLLCTLIHMALSSWSVNCGENEGASGAKWWPFRLNIKHRVAQSPLLIRCQYCGPQTIFIPCRGSVIPLNCLHAYSYVSNTARY